MSHPKGLAYLFLSEMWERFCYYGMRGLLVLYLIDILRKGDSEAFAIYGAYTALVYAAPVLGGKIADTILGYRKAIVLGGILMAIGEFFILGASEAWLYLGMGTIIVGNGYFKANISSIVGKLYGDNDPRRDSGFTIFYIGINVGALLATTIVAEVGLKLGYHYGFGLAGLGMIAGIFIFMSGKKNYLEISSPPNPEKLKQKLVGPLNQFHLVVIGSLAVIPVLYFVLMYNQVVGYLLVATAIYMLGFLIIHAFKGDKILRDRLIIFILLMIFNIVFWACFEQAGSSLTLFAQRNVNRVVLGWEMGAATTQFFNPAFILIFGSLFSMMWIKLSAINKNPNIPAKFGLGIIQLGLGYLVVIIGNLFATDSLVPLLTLVFLYMLHTTGELFLSPIGLSMVTKLAPKNMTGTLMGAWFLSLSASMYVAALLAKLTGSGEGGGGTDHVVDKVDSLAGYVSVYGKMGLITVGIGLFLLIISKPLNKMMHGIK